MLLLIWKERRKYTISGGTKLYVPTGERRARRQKKKWVRDQMNKKI